jgi:hypothetical protein
MARRLVATLALVLAAGSGLVISGSTGAVHLADDPPFQCPFC